MISPGVTESELAETISDPGGREEMKGFGRIAIPAEAIARSIAFAIAQPDDVDVSEIIVRPTARHSSASYLWLSSPDSSTSLNLRLQTQC